MKLDAKKLRVSEPTEEDLSKIKRREIYIICDSVLDTYNIGSIFRLADAIAAKCVYLCGQTETPPNHRIAKAAVGTEKWVPWQYFATAIEAIEDLKKRHSGAKRSRADDKGDIRIIAIEQSPKAVDFRKANYQLPIALIIGNETDGVSKETLALTDQIVEIPMFGINKSLNVMVSLAIVLYKSI